MYCVRLWLSAAVLALLAGCASFVAPAYSPDYPTLDRLKTQSLDKVSVGRFEPRAAEAPVNKITLRGAPFAPASGTFVDYLEQAIRSDLHELRLLDPNATTRIDATVLKNDIDVSGLSTGEGHMQVELTVSRDGRPVHQKVYSASTRFESAFAAAVAVPKVLNHNENWAIFGVDYTEN